MLLTENNAALALLFDNTAAEEKNAFDTVRGLAPIPMKFMCLMLHGSLALGSLVSHQTTGTWLSDFVSVTNKNYVASPMDSTASAQAYLFEHCPGGLECVAVAGASLG